MAKRKDISKKKYNLRKTTTAQRQAVGSKRKRISFEDELLTTESSDNDVIIMKYNTTIQDILDNVKQYDKKWKELDENKKEAFREKCKTFNKNNALAWNVEWLLKTQAPKMSGCIYFIYEKILQANIKYEEIPLKRLELEKKRSELLDQLTQMKNKKKDAKGFNKFIDWKKINILQSKLYDVNIFIPDKVIDEEIDLTDINMEMDPDNKQDIYNISGDDEKGDTNILNIDDIDGDDDDDDDIIVDDKEYSINVSDIDEDNNNDKNIEKIDEIKDENNEKK